MAEADETNSDLCVRHCVVPEWSGGIYRVLCLLPDRLNDLDEFGKCDGKLGLFLGPEPFDGAGQVETRPALVPRFGLDPNAESFFEELQVFGDVFEQTPVALGVARFEVQRELDTATAVVYGHLEVDGWIVAPEFDQRALVARFEMLKLIRQSGPGGVEHPAQELGR